MVLLPNRSSIITSNLSANSRYQAKHRFREVFVLQYTMTYASPLGELLLACDDTGLTGLWFAGAKYYANGLDPAAQQQRTPILADTAKWLDQYFSGKIPDFMPPLHPAGTPFQHAVWALLCNIPYGETITYGDLARQLAAKRGIAHMSAQAIGGAVGHNKISILIPCHRVLGANGSLTGYAAGTETKAALLKLEGAIPGRLR